MVVGELLHAIGLPGGLVLLGSGVLGVYHLREGIQFASRLQAWIMAGALFVLVLLAGAAGLVPGLDPNLGALVGWLVGLVEAAVDAGADLVGGVV